MSSLILLAHYFFVGSINDLFYIYEVLVVLIVTWGILNNQTGLLPLKGHTK